ncbi:Outer membrane protein A [Arenibacter antarcticus]|uniref:OmpA family protein n=1 Tax=Arenibacter antarcticus TaxID=2040469 RepID=A0ABW5VLW1_9FLAO|nr:OmpA family protein [Arenibacter sp. H213]MCM4167019.1 flagellar motor protein MotB [Arenibacter sp. H213]
MNNKTTKKKSLLFAGSLKLTLKGLIIGAMILTGIEAPLQAQEVEYSRPSWYFGLAGGANFNFYDGSTQQLNANFTPATTFHKGSGIGLFLAPSIEFYRPDTRFGVILQAGLDSRKGDFDQQLTDCNCPADLSTDLSYFTVEPSLRFAPFKSNFYLYGGPRFAFNLDKGFTYQQGINPNFPNQVAPADVEGDFSDVEKTIISVQVGAGYDVPLSKTTSKTQLVLSPFVAFQPYFGQYPRSIETWNITTIRAGVVLKLGAGEKVSAKVEEEVVLMVPKAEFTVISPLNVPGELRVTETFPLRNYIYFEKESTAISKRYVLLNKDQVKDFKEEQVEVFVPNIELAGRSKREMTVYYNILNILGDRMGKNPASTIVLVGSSEKGSTEGKLMAESVQKYLVEVFAVNTARIAIEGRDKPKIPSLKPGATKELTLLQEGDRRVSIESNSPALLMEFRSGPAAPLKPVVLVGVQEAPIDSYVTFKAVTEDEAFTSWKMEITDKDGTVQNFGPYTQEEVSLPGKSILGTNPEGDYRMKMIGTTKNGDVITKESSAHIVLWTPSKIEEGMRFSILNEFDDESAIAMYDKYLTEIVAPKIANNAKVIIHGYTDIIGEEDYNLKLSLKRANNVKTILQRAVSKLGTTGVTFETAGLGENSNAAPFGNKLPEERAYNRTVIIDVVLQK